MNESYALARCCNEEKQTPASRAPDFDRGDERFSFGGADLLRFQRRSTMFHHCDFSINF